MAEKRVDMLDDHKSPYRVLRIQKPKWGTKPVTHVLLWNFKGVPHKYTTL